MWSMLWRIFPSFELNYNRKTLETVAGLKTKQKAGKMWRSKQKSLRAMSLKKVGSKKKSIANLLLNRGDDDDGPPEHPDWYMTETETAELFYKEDFFGEARPLIAEWIDRETRRLRQLIRLIALRVIAED